MPLLLICALVSLVVGLIELLLLLCAVCFADHIKRLSSLDGSSTIGRSSSLSQEKQGIIQDTGEAYLSHEETQIKTSTLKRDSNCTDHNSDSNSSLPLSYYFSSLEAALPIRENVSKSVYV